MSTGAITFPRRSSRAPAAPSRTCPPREVLLELVADQQVAHAAHRFGHDEPHASVAELLPQLAEHAGGRHVDVGDRRGLEHHDPHVVAPPDERSHPGSEPLRVRVEQRRVEAIDERAAHLFGLADAGHVVEPEPPRHHAEHGIMRAARASQEVDEREGHRDHDALEHADQGHARHRGDRDRELRAPDPPERSGGAGLEEARHGDRDHGGEGRHRHVAQQAGGHQQHQRDQRRGHETRDLGA